MVRNINLENLTRYKNKKINWSKSVGEDVEFEYDGIIGYFKIISNDNKSVTVDINSSRKTISKQNIIDCKLSTLLGFRNADFRFKENQIVETYLSKIQIIKHDCIKKNNKSTIKIYECKCLQCHQTFSKSEDRLLLKENCPFCVGRYAIKGVTDMWTTNSNMAKLLLNPEDGYILKEHSNKSVDFKCPDCGNIIHKTVNDVASKGLSCSNCSDGISVPEKFISNLLTFLNVDFVFQLSKSRFKWCGNFRYDFYTNHNNLNMIIEVNGKQHYEECSLTARSYPEEKTNDILKENLAINNGINNYIKINCSYSDINWLKNAVLESGLFKLLNVHIKSINWNEVFYNSQKSYLKLACDMWNLNKSINEISNALNLSNTTIRIYLKKGNVLNLCNYNATHEAEKSIDKIKLIGSDISSKPVICLNNNNVFRSVAVCSHEMSKKYNKDIKTSCISRVCRNERKTYNGLTFKYISREEFNMIKIETPELAYGDFLILSTETHDNNIKQKQSA